MPHDISMLGYGPLSKQIRNLAGLTEIPINIFDDQYHSEFDDCHAFGAFLSDEFRNSTFYIGLGYKHLSKKREIIEKLKLLNRHIPAFVHDRSFVDKSACLGDGVIVYPMCNIDMDVEIGAGTIINNSVVISHNSSIGEACYLSPGVVVSGNVQVGHETFVGSGSLISNSVKIGNNVTIGIGTVVTKDVCDNSVVIGNPMKVMNTKLKLI